MIRADGIVKTIYYALIIGVALVFSVAASTA